MCFWQEAVKSQGLVLNIGHKIWSRRRQCKGFFLIIKISQSKESIKPLNCARKKNENLRSLRKPVVTPEIAASPMWKPGSPVGHGAEKFCTPLSSPGTNRQYLLNVSICQETCYIPCKNYWVHFHSGPKRWSLSWGFRRVEPSLPGIEQCDWSYTIRKSGECKARLFWFGLSTVDLTSLQQKAPLTTEMLKSHVRK